MGKTMNINNRNPQVSQRGFQEALKGVDRTADQLLRGNQRCLVPKTEGEHHGGMRNCHVIAEGFLGMISDSRGQVLCWPMSTRSIGRLAQQAISQGNVRSNPVSIIIDQYQPVSRSKNHKDCKFRFACNYHDDKVFKPINTIKEFDLSDPKTRFLLGFRTTAAYTAWYEGFKQWTQHDFKKDSIARRNLQLYPMLAPVYDGIAQFGESTTTAGRKLANEMHRWQTAYSEAAWDRAVTTTITVSPTLRLAGTGIPGSYDHPVTITILPAENGQCTIFVTCLERETPLRKITQAPWRWSARRVAETWAKRLESENPRYWLPTLSQECEFLYVSPDDYNDDGIMNCDDRCEIAKSMAGKAPKIRV